MYNTYPLLSWIHPYQGTFVVCYEIHSAHSTNLMAFYQVYFSLVKEFYTFHLIVLLLCKCLGFRYNKNQLLRENVCFCRATAASAAHREGS